MKAVKPSDVKKAQSAEAGKPIIVGESENVSISPILKGLLVALAVYYAFKFLK